MALVPEEAIRLFTGPGQGLWTEGWNPVVLRGDGTEEGTVFVTKRRGTPTLWVVVDYDKKALRLRYVRMTHDISAGTVEIIVRPDEKSGSEVRVAYSLTSLTESGNRHLESFGPEEFDYLLGWWEKDIRSALRKIQAHIGR